MFECVEYRGCSCGSELCTGEIEIVLFEHEHIEECITFMLKFSEQIEAYTILKVYNDDKTKLDIIVHLNEDTKVIRRLRVQEVEK